MIKKFVLKCNQCTVPYTILEVLPLMPYVEEVHLKISIINKPFIDDDELKNNTYNSLKYLKILKLNINFHILNNYQINSHSNEDIEKKYSN